MTATILDFDAASPQRFYLRVSSTREDVSGWLSAPNADRLERWWNRYRCHYGPLVSPDVAQHVRQLNRGLRFPVERRGRFLAVRPMGRARA